MRAAMLTAPGSVALTSTPRPSCGPTEVVVRMRGVGVCGSDLAVFSGARVPPLMPLVLGHEGAGRIVEIGESVRGLAVGHDVVVEPDYCCLACSACLAGRTSACPRRVAIGLQHPGLLSEFVAVPARFAWPVDARDRLEDLVCVEPAAVARAAVRRSGITPGSRCLVIGAGSQGLLLCQALIANGVHVFVREPHAGRLARAQELGAEALRPDTVDLPYLFETSGADTALESALDHLARPATGVLIGMSSTPLGLSTQDLVVRQLTLVGSLVYDHPRDFRETIALVRNGELRPGDVLAARYAFADTAAALAAAGTAPGKVWIEFPE